MWVERRGERRRRQLGGSSAAPPRLPLPGLNKQQASRTSRCSSSPGRCRLLSTQSKAAIESWRGRGRGGAERRRSSGGGERAAGAAALAQECARAPRKELGASPRSRPLRPPPCARLPRRLQRRPALRLPGTPGGRAAGPPARWAGCAAGRLRRGPAAPRATAGTAQGPPRPGRRPVECSSWRVSDGQVCAAPRQSGRCGCEAGGGSQTTAPSGGSVAAASLGPRAGAQPRPRSQPTGGVTGQEGQAMGGSVQARASQARPH